MLFFGLLTDSYGKDIEDFEAKKVRIFGDEIKNISLEDEYFKGYFKKRLGKSNNFK